MAMPSVSGGKNIFISSTTFGKAIPSEEQGYRNGTTNTKIFKLPNAK
ncbi:MAG: hypothetical protein STSR0008_25830 [Ignavibacterium sp.]